MRLALLALMAPMIISAAPASAGHSTFIADDPLRFPQENHLRNVRQLSNGGENAEAYFSADGKKLIFQSTRDGRECDQIYTMNIDGSDVRMVSTGKGRTTCSYFFTTESGSPIPQRISQAPTVHQSPTSRKDMCGPSIRATTSSAPSRMALT